MNTYITLACLLAVVGLSHGSAIGAYGYGSPWIGSALPIAPAISTANLVKAAPISVIRTHAVAPIITTPVLKTVGYGAPIGYGYGGLGGLGWGGLGWGGLGWGGVGNWGSWGAGLGKHYG